MKSILQNNLKALSSQDHEAAKIIRSAEERSDRIIMEKTRRSQEWTGVYRDESGGKISLASRYHPRKEVARRVADLDFQKTFMFVVFGFGLGYELAEILSRKDTRAVVIVVDPRPDLIRSVLEKIDYRKLVSERNLFWAIGSEQSIQAAFQKHSLTLAQFLNSVAILEHPVLKKPLGNVYAPLRKAFFDAASYSVWLVGNSPNDTLIGITNAFDNLKAILAADDISRYYGTLHDRLAIMCMAGPSLDEQIPVLKTVDRDRVLILCADIILDKLLQEGIVPHLVLTFERGDIIFDYFYEKPDIPQEVRLLAQPVVDARIPERFPGRTFMLFRSATYFETWLAGALGQIPLLECGFSVAHMTFSAARILGCSPIILIGQDLSYNVHGLSYTSGTYRADCTYEDDIREGVGLASEGEHLEVPAIGGGMVRTRHDWWMFLQWLEVEIGRTAAPVIDVKSHGAKIKGTINMPLEKAIRKYGHGPCPPPFGPVVSKTDELFNKRTVKRLKSLEKALEKEQKTTRTVQAVFQKALTGVSSLIDSLNQAEATGQIDTVWENSAGNITTVLLSAFKTIEPVGVEPTLARYVMQPLLFQYALKQTRNITITSMEQAMAWTNDQSRMLEMLIDLASLLEQRLEEFKVKTRSLQENYGRKARVMT